MRALGPMLAIVAAGTAILTAVSVSAAVPPYPTWESSAAFGAWNNGGFILYNNEWNPTAGPQTIWADSYANWGVQSIQAAGNTAVREPWWDSRYGRGGGDAGWDGWRGGG